MAAGVLVVDKPSGPTSFDVVRAVKRALRASKAGHTGTLDPMATGVLAICVEDAVKLQDVLTAGDKAYTADVAFGTATDTEDAEGRETERGDASHLTAEAVAAALTGFTGEIDQIPPMYSAVRVGGRRLHEAARAGEQVERAPRRVLIHALALLGFEPAEGASATAAAPAAWARARLGVRCGKGTYVRTLAADLGRALGVPAHLAGLRRTGAGPFQILQAVRLEEALRLGAEGLAERLLTPDQALLHLPAAHLSVREAAALRHGQALPWTGLAPGLARGLDPGGRLVALCEAGMGTLRPVRVLAPVSSGS